MSVIYLVRHGQASFGTANYDRLSEKGGRRGAPGQAVDCFDALTPGLHGGSRGRLPAGM